MLLDEVRVVRRGPGRPSTTPLSVRADKAYSSRANRQLLRSRGIKAVIPEPADQVANRRRKGNAGGRPIGYDVDDYKGRNVIERFFNRMKHWRAIASRTTSTPSSTAAASCSPPPSTGSSSPETRPRAGALTNSEPAVAAHVDHHAGWAVSRAAGAVMWPTFPRRSDRRRVSPGLPLGRVGSVTTRCRSRRSALQPGVDHRQAGLGSR